MRCTGPTRTCRPRTPACPWIVTWDDHEVQNDYANDVSEHLDPREWFLARRAAAYKAYYEHMPLRRAMVPSGPQMKLYTRQAFGGLALFHVLDDRQYRAPTACPPAGRAGSTVVDVALCSDLNDASRTMLGAAQEAWLDAGLAASRAKWNPRHAADAGGATGPAARARAPGHGPTAGTATPAARIASSCNPCASASRPTR